MGRYRLTDEEKKMRGTLKKSRQLKAPESIMAYDAPPEAPADLPVYARQVWELTAKELQESKILTVVDLPMFKAYCYAVYVCKEAQDTLQVEGMVITQVNTKGQTYQAKNPWLSILNDFTGQANRLGACFGLSPLSRQKLNFAPPKERDALEEYMNGFAGM